MTCPDYYDVIREIHLFFVWGGGFLILRDKGTGKREKIQTRLWFSGMFAFAVTLCWCKRVSSGVPELEFGCWRTVVQV